MVSQPRQGPIPPGSRYYTLAFAAPTPLGSLQSSPKPPVRRRGRDGRAEEEREREGKGGRERKGGGERKRKGRGKGKKEGERKGGRRGEYVHTGTSLSPLRALKKTDGMHTIDVQR